MLTKPSRTGHEAEVKDMQAKIAWEVAEASKSIRSTPEAQLLTAGIASSLLGMLLYVDAFIADEKGTSWMSLMARISSLMLFYNCSRTRERRRFGVDDLHIRREPTIGGRAYAV
jgi:hypothetical protein